VWAAPAAEGEAGLAPDDTAPDTQAAAVEQGVAPDLEQLGEPGPSDTAPAPAGRDPGQAADWGEPGLHLNAQRHRPSPWAPRPGLGSRSVVGRAHWACPIMRDATRLGPGQAGLPQVTRRGEPQQERRLGRNW
jgi:hypothetical protein